MTVNAPTRSNPHLNTLIDRFHGKGRPRVWSMIITIFGDAVVPRGGVVGLGALQKIMDELRIEPNAVRTALSRLAKDEWLVRMKEGRTSSYRLAPAGEASFATATKRIYTTAPKVWNGELILAIAREADATARNIMAEKMRALGFGTPQSGLFIKPDDGSAQPDDPALTFFRAPFEKSSNATDLVRAAWSIDDLAAQYSDIVAAYAPVLDAFDSNHIQPLEALILRTLLIHDWRRAILRDPDLPAALLPPDWPGTKARTTVARLYQKLLTASEQGLDSLDIGQANLSEVQKRFS